MEKTAGNTTQGDFLRFDYIFKWNRIMLRIIGIWPVETERPSIFAYYAVNFLVLLLGIITVAQWADLIVVWGQLDPMLENLNLTLGMSSSLVRIVLVRVNFKALQYCFNEIRDDLCVDHQIFEHRQIMLRRARMSRMMSIASTIFAICFPVFCCTMPLISNSSESGTEPSVKFPFRAAYFFDCTQTPIYEIVYLVESIVFLTAAVGQTPIDAFVAAIAFHICGQLEIFSHNLRAANKNEPMIRSLVERHLKLIEFMQQLESGISSMIFSEFIIHSVGISTLGYRFVLALEDGDVADIGTYSLFMSAVLLGMFVYCHVGQCVIDESVRLNEAVYECGWYDMNPSDVKAILTIQSRTQLPMQLTALNYCAMSHETFVDIVRASASYLSLFRAIRA